MKTTCQKDHPNHEDEYTRLNRLAGQVDGIKRMIEERRYCPDIITQLRSVQSAAKAIEANILRRHLDACIREAFAGTDEADQQSKIDEVITLFRRNA